MLAKCTVYSWYWLLLQLVASVAEYNRMAQMLLLIPSSAAKATGFDYEMKPDLTQAESIRFETAIMVCWIVFISVLKEHILASMLSHYWLDVRKSIGHVNTTTPLTEAAWMLLRDFRLSVRFKHRLLFVCNFVCLYGCCEKLSTSFLMSYGPSRPELNSVDYRFSESTVCIIAASQQNWRNQAATSLEVWKRQ